mgnify:CR=1 FL=1
MSSSVVILMPNINRNAQPATELLARQDFYSSYLRKYSATQVHKPLVIISGASDIPHFENIEVYSISSIQKFAYHAKNCYLKMKQLFVRFVGMNFL